MTMMDMNFKYCHKIMKKHSKLSDAFDLLPEDQRKAVWAIYAVCRKIDDSIDVYGDIQFLNQIKEHIIYCNICFINIINTFKVIG